MNSTDVRPSQATGTAWHQNTAAGTFVLALPYSDYPGEGYQQHEHRPSPASGRRKAKFAFRGTYLEPSTIDKIDLTPVPGDLADAHGRDARQTQPPTGTGRTQEQNQPSKSRRLAAQNIRISAASNLNRIGSAPITHREREQLEMRCRALNTRVIFATYRRDPWG